MNHEQLIIGSQARLVEYLQNELNVVRAERDRLKERVALLESVFTGRIRSNEEIYRELEERFNQIERLVFRAVRHACQVKRRPVTYEEIIKAFYSKFPFLEGKVKVQTIMRRVRRLREKNILDSPKRGFYCPKMEVE